jgi:hypothetical protein
LQEECWMSWESGSKKRWTIISQHQTFKQRSDVSYFT